MLDRKFSVARGATACALIGAALVVGACGSDDDDGGSKGAAQADSGEPGGGREFVATGSDQQQIRQVLHAIQEDYKRGDGEAFCDKVTEADRRDIVGFGRNFNKGKTCVDVIETASAEVRAEGVVQNPTVPVARAQVDGSRARMRVSDGGRPPEWMAFRKVGGEWKLVDAGIDPDPLGAARKRLDAQKRNPKR